MKNQRRALDDARRRLDEAADALSELKSHTEEGLQPPPSQAASQVADSARREALDAARDALRTATMELEAEKLRRRELLSELERLRQTLAERPTPDDLDEAKRQVEASVGARERQLSAKVAEQEEAMVLLKAEQVRLETLRRSLEAQAADALASHRAVEQTLRRELKAANLELDQAAAQSGASQAKAASEIGNLKRRLDHVLNRLRQKEGSEEDAQSQLPRQVQNLRQDLEAARSVIVSMHHQISQLQAVAQEHDSLKKKLEEEQIQESALVGEELRARHALEAAQATMAALNLELSRLREKDAAFSLVVPQVDELLKRETKLQSDLQHGRQELESAKATISSLNVEVSHLKERGAEHALVASRLEEALKLESSLNSDLQRSRQDLESAKEVIAALNLEVSRLGQRDAAHALAETKLEEMLKLESRLNSDLQRAHQELDAAKAMSAALGVELSALRGKEAAHSLVAAKIEEMRNRESQLKSDLQRAQRELEISKAVIAAHGRELSQLREKEAAHAELAAKFQAQLLQAASAPQPQSDRKPDSSPSAPEHVKRPAPQSLEFPAIEPALDPARNQLLRLLDPPIRSAYAYLRRLSSGALPAGQRALLRMTATSLSQAMDSLSTIELALSDAPAPAAAPPLLGVLQSVLAAWELPFKRRDISLVRSLASALPPVIFDPEEMKLSLHHILRNALEALPQGGSLSLRAEGDAGGGVTIEFIDDGPGFPAQWLKRCFEPFACPRRGHAGLGLAAVRCAMRRWGGDAVASNRTDGHGARLALTLSVNAQPVPRQ